MREQFSLSRTVDWTTIFIYMAMVAMGWLNIFAVIYVPDNPDSFFSWQSQAMRQAVFIAAAGIIAVALLHVDINFFEVFAYILYGLLLLVLVAVLVLGKEIAGSKSWIDFGFARLQPSEFAKFTTALVLARYLAEPNKRVEKSSVYLICFAFIVIPVFFTLLQGDTGSAMVFAAFVLVLYREGLPSFFMAVGLSVIGLFVVTLFLRENYIWWLIGTLGVIGGSSLLFMRRTTKNIVLVALFTVAAMGFVRSVDFIISDILKPHQRVRIEILLNPDKDLKGYGYQINQSKIAIGSGGFFGKGYLEGTQTKLDYVPDQHTDFIFCTVGEEHGWFGSFIVIGLFIGLIFRVVFLAERQRTRFSRVYGYSVAAIFFLHFMINIGMTIGLFPVIGIPLPFFSYGGSSLWAFTILLFVMIKLDAHRMQLFGR